MINYIILYTAFSIQKKTRKTIKISTNPKYARGKSNKTCKCGGGKDYIIIFSVFVWDLEKKTPSKLERHVSQKKIKGY